MLEKRAAEQITAEECDAEFDKLYAEEPERKQECLEMHEKMQSRHDALNLDKCACLVWLEPHMKYPPLTDGKISDVYFGDDDESRAEFRATTGMVCTMCGPTPDGFWSRAEAEPLDFEAHTREKHPEAEGYACAMSLEKVLF